MLISHKHKFIFLHCRKNAGTSVSVSLYRYLGPFDIAVGCWKEALDNSISLNLRMKWWLLRYPAILEPLKRISQTRKPFKSNLINNAIKISYRKSYPLGKETDESIYQSPHATANEISYYFPYEWENYYKFCIVRNPFSRLVSEYFWCIKHIDSRRKYVPNFKEFIKSLELNDDKHGILPYIKNNWNIYSINNCIAVDYVCCYENLINDLSFICNNIGLNWDKWIPTTKNNQKSFFYKDMYSQNEIDLVYRLYKNEIEAFGYTF